MREWWSRLRGTFGRADDLTDEVEANLQIAIAEYIAEGLSPAEARAAALRRFGNVTLTVESAREAWTLRWLDTLLQDVRYGLRSMARSRASAAVIIVTLALGIGATTAIFSVVEQALLRPLPYRHADRLAILEESTPKIDGFSVSWVNYQNWLRDNRSFEGMAGYSWGRMVLTRRGEAVFTFPSEVTSGFFHLLEVRPFAGRFFNESDDRPSSVATAILAYAFWRSRFGGDSKVVGSAIDLDGRAYQVIGIAPPDFRFGAEADLYLPLGLRDGAITDRSKHAGMRVLGLLKASVPLAAARSDLNELMKRYARMEPGAESDHRVASEMLGAQRQQAYGRPLYMLFGAVLLVLLIACANVASLVLARSVARAREMAIRAAIGAGGGRLRRQLFTENVLIAAIGGLLGLALAYWILWALVRAAPPSLPKLEANLNWPVLLFIAGVTLVTGVLLGLAPSLAATRLSLVTALHGAGRTSTGGRGAHTSRSALVAIEIGMTLVLAFASGLLLKSLLNIETKDPGFVPDRVLEVALELPEQGYKADVVKQNFFVKLMEAMRRVRGVTDVGAICSAPASGECFDWFYTLVGKPQTPGDEQGAFFNVAEPGYFRAMRIPLREGRDFSTVDSAGGPPAAIVNDAFARQWYPHESAVGHQIKYGGPQREGPVYQIVGVVGNTAQFGLDARVYPEIYLPYAQSTTPAMKILIRVNGEPERVIPNVRRVVASLDRHLPIQSIQPFTQVVESSLAGRRFLALLLALFAGLAMLLAAIGIYGLLSYWVSMREDEIAIRMALGAERGKILRWVGAQAMRLAIIGVMLGAAAGLFASRWLESLLYGVSARNPSIIIGAVVMVLVIALAAAALPAWRATRVDAVSRLNHT